MPREPYHPVFGAMPKTPNVVELQITQEYLGHSTHLVYLAPMWKEFFDSDTFVKGAGIDRRQGRRRHAPGPPAHRHCRRGQYRQRAQLDWPPLRCRQLVRLRPAGVGLVADLRGHRRRVDQADLEPHAGDREGDRDVDARLARGVRELHDAARPPSPDWRRPLRGDARERRPAAARLVGASTTTAPTRKASASTARGTAAAPWTSTPSRTPTGGTIRRPRPRTCCSGSITCRGTTG